MDPKIAPDPELIGVASEAIDELSRYGRLQRHKLAMSGAAVFWQEQARRGGLPSHWKDRRTVSVLREGQRTDWKIYVQTVSGIRMGFAESKDGRSLRLLLLVPTDQATLREAVEETSKRT